MRGFSRHRAIPARVGSEITSHRAHPDPDPGVGPNTDTDAGTDTDTDAGAALVRALHDAHGAALYSFCLRFTADTQHAEDVVQEVLLRAWRHADTLREDPRPVRPWLFTTARNLLTDAHRAAAARPVLVPDADNTTHTVAGRDDINQAVESWTMAQALGQLSEEHREVLVHAHWLGRSVTEIAELLAIPTGTVKSRTYYAMRALRLALDERGLS